MSIPELDRAMEALEHALEHIRGPGAPRLVLGRVQKVLYRRYPPAAMLDSIVLYHVRAHPGISQRDLREGVGRRTADVGAAVRRLLGSGRLEDRGGEAGRSLYAVPGPRPQGNAGNGQGGSPAGRGYVGAGSALNGAQKATRSGKGVRTPVTLSAED